LLFPLLYKGLEDRSTWVFFIIGLVSSLVVVFFKLVLYPTLPSADVFKDITGAIERLPRFWIVCKQLVSQSIAYSLNPNLFAKMAVSSTFLPIFAVSFILFLYIINQSKSYLNNMVAKKILVIGLFMYTSSILGLSVVTPVDSEFQLFGIANRVNLFTSFSLGILIIGSVLLIPKKFLSSIILSLILATNLSYLFTEKGYWLRSWDLQKKYIKEMSSINISNNECKGYMIFIFTQDNYQNSTDPAPFLNSPWSVNLITKHALKDINTSAKIVNDTSVLNKESFNFESRYYSQDYEKSCFKPLFLSKDGVFEL